MRKLNTNLQWELGEKNVEICLFQILKIEIGTKNIYRQFVYNLYPLEINGLIEIEKFLFSAAGM